MRRAALVLAAGLCPGATEQASANAAQLVCRISLPAIRNPRRGAAPAPSASFPLREEQQIDQPLPRDWMEPNDGLL